MRRRIRYLEELQNKYDELDEEFEEEMRALEKKYRALYGEIACCACSGNWTSCGSCYCSPFRSCIAPRRGCRQRQ